MPGDPSYEALNLQDLCNAGADVLPAEANRPHPTRGRVELRGLPFLIGTDDKQGDCFLVPSEAVSLDIGKQARHVVVAHRLLAPTKSAGHGIGTAVAEYVFHLANGTSHAVSIRERFEIQIVQPEWGRFPFLAVSDTLDHKVDRFEGRWDRAGERLAEHSLGWPKDFFLWCWENPDPDIVLERFEIRPTEHRILVAGVTLSTLDEHPFVRTPARPVRLTVTDSTAQPKTGVLELHVDRGVATYPQAVADGGERIGWGTPSPDGASPAYASIAALPSATVRISHDGTELGAVRWSDVERDGHASTDRVRVELVDPGRNWVHVTVLDDATGKPVPCRVHFRSPAGVPYQPHGHHQHVNQNLGSWHQDVGGDVRLGETTYAYIDGTCQGWLPRGDVLVDIARGFEYEPLRETVRIEPGQRDVTLRLRRNVDLASTGWYSGDSHVHFLSTAGAQLEQLGEDLRVVNLLQAQWGALFTNTEDFRGKPAVIDGGGYFIYVGQENRQHVLGHLVMWGMKRPVMPWSSDGPDEADLGGALDTTLSDWADRVHAEGGTVVAAHFPNPNGEPAVLITTGRADAVETLAASPDGLAEYYRYLNSGYRLPLVGGTDKMSNRVPVGLYRTYAQLDTDEELTYEGWCRAVRRGRTFVSGGPLLSFTVDGKVVGDTIELAGPGTVTAEASVTSVFPLRSLELVCNGEVVAQVSEVGAHELRLSEHVRIDGSAWLAMRAYGVDNHLDEWARPVFAHTSPVFVACGGPWAMADPEGLHYLRTLVQGAREYVRHTAVRRDDTLTTHHHGEPDHLAWLERPFAEALEALDQRR